MYNFADYLIVCSITRNTIHNAVNPDRYAVGQNVATTWSYGRKPPSKDKPEFERHVMGWFDEVTTDTHAGNIYL